MYVVWSASKCNEYTIWLPDKWRRRSIRLMDDETRVDAEDEATVGFDAIAQIAELSGHAPAPPDK